MFPSSTPFFRSCGLLGEDLPFSLQRRSDISMRRHFWVLRRLWSPPSLPPLLRVGSSFPFHYQPSFADPFFPSASCLSFGKEPFPASFYGPLSYTPVLFLRAKGFDRFSAAFFSTPFSPPPFPCEKSPGLRLSQAAVFIFRSFLFGGCPLGC